MAKRFTDTDKYKKPFIRGLKGAYKLLWDYLYHDCNHAGIWIKDFDIAQIYIGVDMVINEEEALKNFNQDEERIVVLNGGSKWFIPDFIEFQYGELNPENRAHNSVISQLNKCGIDYLTLRENKGLTRGLQAPMDMDKDKDKDKDIYRSFKHLKISTGEIQKILSEGWTQEQIDSTLDSIENYKQNTKYTSLNLTCRKWLKKEYKEPTEDLKNITVDKL